jgi:hypothetical protein
MSEEPELQFIPAAGVWPIEAKRDGVPLVFTGDFNQTRILAEKALAASARLIDLVAYGLIVLGLLGFVYAAYSLGLPNLDIFFFFRAGWPNLLVWVGALGALYVWSRRVQEAAEYEVTRVLSAANLQKWSSSGSELNVYNLYTRGARAVWNKVAELMAKKSQSEPSLSDIFLALLENDSIQMVFYRFGISPEDVKTLLQSSASSTTVVEKEAEIVARLPFVAFSEALKLRNRSVDPLMLLCALVQLLPEEHPVQKFFFDIDLTYDKLEVIASWLFNLDLLVEEDKVFRRLAKHKSDAGINKGLTSVPTPYLDQFSVDLTIKAKYHQLPLTMGR